MKKSIVLTIALAIGSFGAFAQGNILISASHSIFGGTTSGTLAGAQNDYAALLFFTTQSAAQAAANGALAGSATIGSPSATLGTYNTTTAWSSLLTGAILVDGTVSGIPAVTQITATTGSFAYNASSSYTCDNITGGVAYWGVMIAWNPGTGGNTTIASASAAGDLVGWSKVFTYTPSVPPATAPTMSASIGTFGVGGAVPEPSTMALAALGGASLLLFRRRK
jgi:hypothetical protein